MITLTLSDFSSSALQRLWCTGREASQPAPYGRKANQDFHDPSSGRTENPSPADEPRIRCGATPSVLGSRFLVLCLPTNSGSPAYKAKEPLPPRSVVQCAVASILHTQVRG